MRNFKLAQLILSIILLTNISFAQECDSTCGDEVKDQIQFHLVNDYSVSYLKMLSPSSGLRFKIDLGLSGSSGDGNATNKSYFISNQLPQRSSEERLTENNGSSQYINLVINYMFNYELEDGVSCFVGAGPLLSYSRAHSKSTNDIKGIMPDHTNYYQTISEFSDNFIGVGLQIALGMEVNFTKSFSLLTEFNLNGTYGWSKHSYTSENNSTSANKNDYSENENSWNYGLNKLKLGIAYRF